MAEDYEKEIQDVDREVSELKKMMDDVARKFAAEAISAIQAWVPVRAEQLFISHATTLPLAPKAAKFKGAVQGYIAGLPGAATAALIRPEHWFHHKEAATLTSMGPDLYQMRGVAGPFVLEEAIREVLDPFYAIFESEGISVGGSRKHPIPEFTAPMSSVVTEYAAAIKRLRSLYHRRDELEREMRRAAAKADWNQV